MKYIGSGGFRHVQHVQPLQKGGLHKRTEKFAAAIVVCIAARVLNKMSMMTTVCVSAPTVSGERSRGEGSTEYSYISPPPHFF